MFAKKSLGQNFLNSGAALKAIVDAGELSRSDTVLEIGPGRGALTAALLKSGAKIVAIEKDRELIPFLKEKFAKEIEKEKLTLIEGDILEIDAEKLGLKDYKLIANIPYYITGEIIRKFLEEDRQPRIMVLLVQKEVAERIVARDGKGSILSIAVKSYAKPRLVVKVPRGAFTPAPNVDSAVIAFTDISKNLFTESKVSEKRFFEVMKAGFAHKRKKLGGNLKEMSDSLDKKLFEQLKDKRAEELTVTDWFALLS